MCCFLFNHLVILVSHLIFWFDMQNTSMQQLNYMKWIKWIKYNIRHEILSNMLSRNAIKPYPYEVAKKMNTSNLKSTMSQCLEKPYFIHSTAGFLEVHVLCNSHQIYLVIKFSCLVKRVTLFHKKISEI